MPVFSPPSVSKQDTKKMQWGITHCSHNGRLVDNTITKANNNFCPYRDNEAESTHGLYEIFFLE
jgi:hypothetical protein